MPLPAFYRRLAALLRRQHIAGVGFGHVFQKWRRSRKKLALDLRHMDVPRSFRRHAERVFHEGCGHAAQLAKSVYRQDAGLVAMGVRDTLRDQTGAALSGQSQILVDVADPSSPPKRLWLIGR
jgi:hypothetical protein